MNDLEILKKAIVKAVKNGFEWHNPWSFEYPDYYAMIFSHDFAKAFFGEKFGKDGVDMWIEAWKYHLKTMVLEKNPIKYLEKFL